MHIPINFRVVRQLAVLPANQPLGGANPKSPIALGEQAPHEVAGLLLTRRWLPRDAPCPIESKQAEFRAQPEITVGRLGDGPDDPFEKASADRPGGVRVLTDV